ncbi:MAG: hypothetical protein Salg2KO_03830 [Salibacteraceae bacterium]
MLLLGAALTITGQGWTLFIHLLAFVAFSGSLEAGRVRSLITVIKIGIFNVPLSGFKFLKDLRKPEVMPSPRFQRLLRHYYYLAPVGIIILFVGIYSASNPVFEGYVADLTGGLADWLEQLASMLNLQWIGTFIFGLIISVYAFVRYIPDGWLDFDRLTPDVLKRKRIGNNGFNSPLSLKYEWRAGIFLLIALNLLIAVINAIDIYWVWINFSWTGEFLKQFVHEGTYLLLLSILISMAIVLYFFRGNLNFYSENKWMRWLCYGWLAQNGILTISVLIRNLHYIDHFALAGKRIGVIFFLALVVFGLYTIARKVRNRHTYFYLIRWNALAAFIILVLSAVPNWNRIIAEYNFTHAEESFLHLDYLATFSADYLPYLDVSLEELKRLEAIQAEKFPFDEEYMTPEVYHNRIQTKKQALIESAETNTWQEWTWAKQKAIAYAQNNPE